MLSAVFDKRSVPSRARLQCAARAITPARAIRCRAVALPWCLQYEDNEPVVLWLSKVGPYHNPQEVYSYYALPFCKPDQPLIPETRIGGLGEILEGSELQNSDLPIAFGG